MVRANRRAQGRHLGQRDHPVGVGRFLKLGALVMPPALLLAIGAANVSKTTAKAFSSQSRSRLSGVLTRIEAIPMPKRKSFVSRKAASAPAFSIGRHQMLGGVRRSAGGQTPRFLHVFGMDAYNGTARLNANKPELLMVLDRPEIPLHTNGSENDIRCHVTRRKVSVGTRSDIGRDCRDAFLPASSSKSLSGTTLATDSPSRALTPFPGLPEIILARAQSP